MKTLIAIALSLIFACTAFGQIEGELATSWDGTPLVFRQGFWWHNGVAFTRQRIVNSCGQYTWQYYYAPTVVAEQTRIVNTVKPTDANWRNELLRLAETREKYAQKLQLNALEHAQYMEAIKEFKFGPPPGLGSYAGYSQLGYTFTGAVTNFGVNGSSQYGYSYKDLAAIYGDNGLAQMQQSLGQSVNQVGSILDKAIHGTLDLTAQTAAGNAKLAEKVINGQIVIEVAKVLNAQPAVAANYSFSVGPNNVMKADSSKVPDAQKEQNLKAWGAMAGPKCAACHTEGNIKGGFDLNKYLGMSPAEKQRVWSMINHQDPQKRMPLQLNGTAVERPGVALTDAEKALWYLN